MIIHMSADLSVNLAGLALHSPLAVASGTFAFGREYGLHFDLNLLGAICVKGLTLTARPGNPTPRVAETPMGMLNSVGFQNPGVHAFIQEELPFLRQYCPKVIANLTGNTPEEFAELAAILSGAGVDALEVNISCPNIKEGGIAFGTDPSAAAQVTRLVKDHAGETPVLVKLSPNVTDIAEIARAVEAAGADGLSLINTLHGMRIDVRTRRPILALQTGGLSGPAILPVALACMYKVYKAVKIPLLGMGGVSCARDVVEMMLAGASAVAIGTVLFADPQAPVKIMEELPALCATLGVTRLSELTGALRA